MPHQEILRRFGLASGQPVEGGLDVTTPIDGTRGPRWRRTRAPMSKMIVRADAFKAWRGVLRRAAVNERLGEELRG
jgi:hypothetical protein